jgi:hypothetical protein
MPIIQMEYTKTNKFPRKSPHDLYYARIKAVREFLPKNWRTILFEEYPEYDTKVGYNFVHNVINMRTADIYLTEKIEQISRKYMETHESSIKPIS